MQMEADLGDLDLDLIMAEGNDSQTHSVCPFTSVWRVKGKINGQKQKSRHHF